MEKPVALAKFLGPSLKCQLASPPHSLALSVCLPRPEVLAASALMHGVWSVRGMAPSAGSYQGNSLSLNPRVTAQLCLLLGSIGLVRCGQTVQPRWAPCRSWLLNAAVNLPLNLSLPSTLE